MVVRHVSEFVATRNKSLWIKSHAQLKSRRRKTQSGHGHSTGMDAESLGRGFAFLQQWIVLCSPRATLFDQTLALDKQVMRHKLLFLEGENKVYTDKCNICTFL
jgi:hypothetical protein